MKHVISRVAALLCVLACVTVAAAEIWSVGRGPQTTDENGGRPGVWRHFDRHGRLTRVDVDSNFDGKPDIEEYYEQGVLVRRESDRNFNGQADLIEEFDVATHGQTRSVIDDDFDGTADVLVLFRDGRPVFSRRAGSNHPDGNGRQTVHREDGVRLAPLVDPFQSDPAVRTRHATPGDEGCVGLSTSGGLPKARFTQLGRLTPSAPILIAAAIPPRQLQTLPRSPRAPPVI